MTPIERLLSMLPDAQKTANGWSARCPAHEDRRASLSIAEGDDGRALLTCHAGCAADAVCTAVGLRVADLMPAAVRSKSNGKPKIVATYRYRDEAGNLVSEVVRYDPKDFRQRRPEANGSWSWVVKGCRIVLYRLLELLAEPERIVFVVEGEKDVESLLRLELIATCNAGGAGKFTSEHARFLRGRRVVILPDNDEPGRNHAQRVAQLLHGVAEAVRIVELPGLAAKGDVSDWIAAGGTREQLVRFIDSSPDWSPPAAASANQQWPEIESFEDDTTVELPEFPVGALPEPLRAWVADESYATQTPPDLAALLALAIISAMIAKRVEISPRTGFVEPANLYVAILLGPGNRKSAVFADAIRPLREIEVELIDAARPAIAREQSDQRQDEQRLKRLEKEAIGSDGAHAHHEAGVLAEKLANNPEPALPRLIIDDATSEKLGMILAEQNGRIASMSPEGGVFDLMAGLYSKSGIPQFGVYLMGHSGDDLTVDRVSRKSIHVERPALTCAYAMQPQVIKGLADNTAFRGRGLLARFLYAAPKSWVGQREIATEPVSVGSNEAYRQLVRGLYEQFK